MTMPMNQQDQPPSATEQKLRQATRKPNFFILGAPKCATTSLSNWLREHPNVFVPIRKEPEFFNTDDEPHKHGGIANLDAYEALFRDACEKHLAVGEGSVWYLSSSTAISNILRYQPEARFIAMVRNPVEIAPALHAEVVMFGRENVRDFGTAWSLQEQRRHGRRMPAFSSARRRLLYGEVCSLGAQIERLLSMVPAHRVLVLVVDDIRSDPRREYLRVLEFLGVPDDGRDSFPSYNTARHPTRARLPRLWYVLRELKFRLGISSSGKWLAKIRREIKVTNGREPISAELVKVLKRYFRADIEKLGGLLNRDLRTWYSE
jgi:hypothetical protein